MTRILESFGCVDDFTPPSGVVPPIVGLKVLDGLVCLIEGCGYLSASLRTMQEHFKITHPNDQWRPNTKERDIQRVYEFRGNQTLILVDLKQIMPPQQRAFADYQDEIRKKAPRVDPDIYHVDQDTRKHGTFLAKMGWNKAIEGLQVTQLLQVVSSPADEEEHLQLLHTAVHNWLHAICVMLPNLDLTFLRLINTSKG